MNCRNLTANDIPQLVQLMVRAGASVARSTSPEVFQAVCRDACARRKPPCFSIVVTEEEEKLAGYVVAHIGGPAFWRAFAFRHPMIAGKILLKRGTRLLHRLRQNPWTKPVPPSSPPASSDASPNQFTFVLADDGSRSWQDSGLRIARIQHIGVHPDYRGRGVGTRLYQRLFTTLTEIGVTRVDANIDRNNVASLRMHHRTGWRIVDKQGYFFATIDL